MAEKDDLPETFNVTVWLRSGINNLADLRSVEHKVPAFGVENGMLMLIDGHRRTIYAEGVWHSYEVEPV